MIDPVILILVAATLGIFLGLLFGSYVIRVISRMVNLQDFGPQS